MRLRISSLLILSQPSFLQFTVLDKDALCELVSFLEDLLIIDVGHGWDEALEEKQDMTDTQGSKSAH